MVDRYLLPVPKSLSFNSYVYAKKHRLFAVLYIFNGMLLTFQIGRLIYLRKTCSKPGGYFVDWGSPDAPKKVRYFS